MIASPIPAGISMKGCPVHRDAPRPFTIPEATPTGSGHRTAAIVTGVEPRLGLPKKSGINNCVQNIAKAPKIADRATVFEVAAADVRFISFLAIVDKLQFPLELTGFS